MIHPTVKFWHRDLSNIGGCSIGAHSTVHAGVHIMDGVVIGTHCKIEAGAIIPPGVTIGNGCFIGPGVIFTNDREMPLIFDTTPFKPVETKIHNHVRIGAGARILAGVTLEPLSVIGLAAVVINDVKADTTVVGNPARVVEY